MQPPRKMLKYTAKFKSIFVRNDIVNKISNLSNINSVNVPFLCAGGRGVPVPATITEQTKILRSINKAHGKLTGVNLVLHQ